MRVGIAGTGKMGSTVAQRLASLGHEVRVWNRSQARAQPLLDAGLAWADTPQALALASEVVISFLTDEAALEAVHLGPQGLFAGAQGGAVLLEMSTVPPARQKAMGEKARAAGIAYLESPVGGSVGPAKEGKLLAFVGGEEATLARVRPLMEQMCKRIEWVGPHGAGSLVKLAVNLPLMVYWQTLSESLSLVEPLGLDPQRMVDILSDSSGGPNMLKVRGGMIAQALAGTPSAQVTVDLATMRKDVRSMIEQGRQQGRAMPLTRQTLAQLDRAAAQGLDGKDCSQLPVWWLGTGSRDAG
jgi:3-hydroxyisobutyrate dehydrogenase